MARFIHFIDDQKRDAQVTFSSLNPKAKVRMVLPDGSAPETLRVIKGSATTAVAHLCDALIGPLESPDGTAELVREIELAEHIIESDPEVDLELHGKVHNRCRPRVCEFTDASSFPTEGRGAYILGKT